MWRGGSRSGLSVAAPFVWRCPSNLAVAPFPHPAHRTGRADLPHPARQLVVLPTRGPTGQRMGSLQAEEPVLGKEVVGPAMMVVASGNAPSSALMA